MPLNRFVNFANSISYETPYFATVRDTFFVLNGYFPEDSCWNEHKHHIGIFSCVLFFYALLRGAIALLSKRQVPLILRAFLGIIIFPVLLVATWLSKAILSFAFTLILAVTVLLIIKLARANQPTLSSLRMTTPESNTTKGHSSLSTQIKKLFNDRKDWMGIRGLIQATVLPPTPQPATMLQTTPMSVSVAPNFPMNADQVITPDQIQAATSSMASDTKLPTILKQPVQTPAQENVDITQVDAIEIVTKVTQSGQHIETIPHNQTLIVKAGVTGVYIEVVGNNCNMILEEKTQVRCDLVGVNFNVVVGHNGEFFSNKIGANSKITVFSGGKMFAGYVDNNCVLKIQPYAKSVIIKSRGRNFQITDPDRIMKVR